MVQRYPILTWEKNKTLFPQTSKIPLWLASMALVKSPRAQWNNLVSSPLALGQVNITYKHSWLLISSLISIRNIKNLFSLLYFSRQVPCVSPGCNVTIDHRTSIFVVVYHHNWHPCHVLNMYLQ